MFEIFIYGMIAGFFLNPFLAALTAILTNAWAASHAPNACNQDCNQGRTCDCKGKQNGIS